MALDVKQVARMQCEVQSGSTWEQRTAQVPDTAEAREMWAVIAREVAAIVARGGTVDVLSD